MYVLTFTIFSLVGLYIINLISKSLSVKVSQLNYEMKNLQKVLKINKKTNSH